MFVKEQLVATQAGLDSLLLFANAIYDAYLDNPYHSSRHAIDVTFMAYYFYTDMGVRDRIRLLQIDLVALLIAALGHDVLHPGTNNALEVCYIHLGIRKNSACAEIPQCVSAGIPVV